MMTTKTFCDVCDVEMTGRTSAVTVKANDVPITAMPDGKAHDVCELCLCMAFARKMPHNTLKILAYATMPHPGEPQFSEIERSYTLGGSDGLNGATSLQTKTLGRVLTDSMLNAAVAYVRTLRPGLSIADYWQGAWQAMYDAA